MSGRVENTSLNDTGLVTWIPLNSTDSTNVVDRINVSVKGVFNGNYSYSEPSSLDGSIFSELSNLRGYWHGDGNARDYSFYSNEGFLSNTVTEGYTPGVFNQSFNFDGDYVSISDSYTLSFGDGISDSPFSVCSWIRMDDASTFRILSKSSSGGAFEYDFMTANSDKLYFIIYDGEDGNCVGRYYDSVLTSYEGEWIHVCGTYDGRGGANAQQGINLTINGEVVDDTNYHQGTYVAMEDTAASLGIGIRNAGDTANGSIDEVMIFSKELSLDEIEFLYKSGSSNHSNNGVGVNWTESSSGSQEFTEVNVTHKEASFNISPLYNYLVSDLIYEDDSVVDSVSYTLNYVDTSAPSIALVSPTDSSSTTSTSITFQFNVSDTLSDIDYCSVFLDGTEYENTSIISESETNTISISSIGTGTHSWKVFCNDTLGNEANSSSRSFTIVAPSTKDSTTSGGSSSQVSLGSDSDIFGSTTKVRYGYQYNFNFGGEGHKFLLRSINRESREVTIDVYSDKKEVVLKEGESEKVDLDGDGEFDIVMTLEKIYSDSVAVDLLISDYVVSGSDDSGDVSEGAVGEVIEEEGGWIYWVIGLLILVAVAVAVVVWRKKR